MVVHVKTPTQMVFHNNKHKTKARVGSKAISLKGKVGNTLATYIYIDPRLRE